ncbi:hypothetical protein NQ317_008547 [Molorchus minor]|uniref:Uncharacterized protein n=1 Tax=Molorchus minor TaxID=1323400 RepID=A0ABQ9IYS8_9CUCU|nr:hypothetical protein NQ317_008547 [Molorchus minor]
MSPTTMPYATASEFDIENFKPQLEVRVRQVYFFMKFGVQLLNGTLDVLRSNNFRPLIGMFKQCEFQFSTIKK